MMLRNATLGRDKLLGIDKGLGWVLRDELQPKHYAPYPSKNDWTNARVSSATARQRNSGNDNSYTFRTRLIPLIGLPVLIVGVLVSVV